MEKWYSHNLTEEKVKDLERVYAKITKSDFGMLSDWPANELCLNLDLDLDDGKHVYVQITDMGDVYQLLKRTAAKNVSSLEGKVVEAYRDDGRFCSGISVNERLISVLAKN